MGDACQDSTEEARPPCRPSHQRRREILQGLGQGSAPRQPWVAVVADDWDTQMLPFPRPRLSRHRPRPARPGSTQTGDGRDMDHYADDLAALTAHLDLEGRGGTSVLTWRRRSRALSRAMVKAGSQKRDPQCRAPLREDEAIPAGWPRRFGFGFRRSSPANRAQLTTICRRDRSTATTGRVRTKRRA